MSAADDAGVEQRLFVHVEGMSSPTDPELEAAGTLAGFSQLAHPKVPPRPNQYPITTLTAHQNYDGPPARPLIAPNALFHQPSAPIVPAPREYCVGLNDERVVEHAKSNPLQCYKSFALFGGRG